MNKQVISAIAVATLLCTAAAQAHHSVSMFELSSPVWVKGTVISFEAKNPHVMMELETKGSDGKTQRLSIEGPSLSRFSDRMHAKENFLKAGDAIEVCGFPFKQSVQDNAASGNRALPAYHAHAVQMPDGKMRMYGPYGKMENCVRANDKVETWVEFVDADPLAQQAWCNSAVYTAFPSLAPKGFVDEVNRRIKTPCK